ncbi:50S ribosomal protein L10 [Spiroplasma endosymbiont of Aspidapion aeneum]|uniref:50S ribosomal protein L10 n=1 Tax=Spiroplasma endosymbiont of Aspidapion aeneum TaxID=3066276 RepID=UPI00313CD207
MTNTRPSHAKKAEIVKDIRNRIEKSQGVVIAKYTNLSVQQIDSLRNYAREKNVYIKVYKDSLFERAINELKIEGLHDYLTDQNIFLFSEEDGITAPKLVADFAKKNPDLLLKAGIFEGRIMGTDEINEIANLPGRDELYSMFASALVYPLRQLMLVMKEVAKSKTD